MMLCDKVKCFWSIIPFLIFFTYASLSAAGCNKDAVYIKPGITELQASASAAGKGGMLSSAWHEAIIHISCTGMTTGPSAEYIYRYNVRAAYAGSGVTFEGRFYPFWLTSNSDVVMIASIAPPGEDFSPIDTNNFDYYFKVKKPDAKGIMDEQVRVRIRYFSKSSNLTAGLKVLNELPFISGGVYGGGIGLTCPANACSGEVPPVSISSLSFSVNSISCTLDAPSLVKMRSLDLTSLSNVGATAEGATFQLGVSCNKASVAYRAYYSMNDVYDSANTSSNLTLAALPDQASGVALRVLDNGQPVRFGLGGSLESMGMMAVTGGSLKKILSVGYVRTSDIVRPGKVNAGVTVTLSYE